MENKLEQLLNILIQRGWKPFGEGCHRSPYKRVSIHKNHDKERTYVLFDSNNHSHWKVLRQVVSKESGLWQFVCENGMVKHDQYTNTVWEQIYEDERDSETYRTKYGEGRYLFRLIESALKDESELESFILDNIKI